MKRILITILAVGLIILLYGCNSKSEGDIGKGKAFPSFWASDKEERENNSNNPFLFFNELTTYEDIVEAYGKPNVEDDMIYLDGRLRYLDFELFGTTGGLRFDITREHERSVTWGYEYPGHIGWKSKDDSRYRASAEDKHIAQEYLNKAIDFFTELYGDPKIQDDGDYAWNFSDSLFTRYVLIEFEDGGFSVYYRILW